MSLDQFVTAVKTLSSQANYAELCDHLNKSQEVTLTIQLRKDGANNQYLC